MTTQSGHWVKNQLQNRRVFALALVKDGLENHNRGVGEKKQIKWVENNIVSHFRKSSQGSFLCGGDT